MPFTLPPLPVAVLYYIQWWSIPRSWHPCGINHNKESSMKHMISLAGLLSLSSLVGLIICGVGRGSSVKTCQKVVTR